MNKNVCKILGYSEYVQKESGEMKLRIYIALPSNDKKFKGYLPVNPIFFEYDEQLTHNLDEAIESGRDVEFDIETNLITQKIQYKSFIF